VRDLCVMFVGLVCDTEVQWCIGLLLTTELAEKADILQ
jgi:hypothetical protein